MFQGLLRPVQPYLLPPIFNPMTLLTSLVPRSIEAEDWERGGEGLIRKKENRLGSRGVGLGGLLWLFFMLLVGLPAASPQNKTPKQTKKNKQQQQNACRDWDACKKVGISFFLLNVCFAADRLYGFQQIYNTTGTRGR